MANDVLPSLDEVPTAWADEHPQATDEEIDLGNALGEAIDIDDDNDWCGDAPPEMIRPPR